jgi:hypothetical protein
MCKHTPSTDVKPKLPAGDTGLEDIPQAQISPEEEETPGDTQPIVPPATTPPLGEIAPEAEQPEVEEQEEEPQDEGQDTTGPLT